MAKPNGPWRITFDTNPDDCNLSCIMCEDHSPHSSTQRDRIQARIPKRRMPIELIDSIVAQAKSTGLREIIPSTMGEPLLYKDFSAILDICKKYDVKLNLTTNGTFPIKGAKTWAELIVPVTSDVKISWNGATKATQEKIMRGSKWEKVLDNVKEFIAVRDYYAEREGDYCRVTFQLTFLEENVDELADMVRLAAELGVDRLKGHHLWAHFQEIEQSSMRRDLQAIERWNLAVQQAYQAVAEKKLPNGKEVLLENIYPLQPTMKFVPDADDECPFLSKEAWVATDGRFNPCCAPDKERRELGEFGNLHDKSLQSIWESPIYQNLKANYVQQNVCQKCNMRKPKQVSQ